jgi:hypothetical protein
VFHFQPDRRGPKPAHRAPGPPAEFLAQSASAGSAGSPRSEETAGRQLGKRPTFHSADQRPS